MSTGHFQEAEKLIADNQKLENGKVRFLYWVNAGLIEHLNGKFKESNEFFEKADLFIEDHRKKAIEEGAAFLLNPKISTYHGEDHEVLLINYYKALNYYMLGDINDALVEVRRMDLRLQSLSEKYKGEKKFSKDAYLHLLMGLVYEADKNYNDAFISFRNAFEIYESYYQTEFGVFAPKQLKSDLIRSAALAGMREEQVSYEKKFDIKYDVDSEKDASVVVLWNNGLGPVKEEWGINFSIIYTGGGWVTFASPKYGLSFPFYVGNQDLAGLTWIKVVFPRYVERKERFTSARIISDGNSYAFEKAEDLNKVSFHVLEQRMAKEFGKSLLRVALKQAAAYKAGQNSDRPGVGVALSVAASVTESADTRNWQTLPHSMYYTRVPVNSGKQQIEIELNGQGATPVTHTLDVDTRNGQTLLYPFYSLASYDPVTLNRAK